MSGNSDISAKDWKARAAQRRRRLWTSLAILAAFGFVAGYLSGYYESETSIFAGGNLPPTVALVIAALLGISLTIGCWYYFRISDELDQQINLKAASAAAYVSLAGYPVWFILARGGWAGEPDAFILFVATAAVYTCVYFWKKYV